MLVPRINSLKRLETDEGVLVTIRGKAVTVRAVLVLFSANNLGINTLWLY